jgi:hypothetical protein
MPQRPLTLPPSGRPLRRTTAGNRLTSRRCDTVRFLTAGYDVQDWIRIHRLLIDKEVQFTDLAIQVANGEVRPSELEVERAALLALRELCNATYQKAFPASAVRSDS